ncbi:MAG: hypothetical protein EH225_09830, partial [Calditrichaeota bacterium]
MRFFFCSVLIFFIISALWSQPASFYRIEHQDNQSLLIVFEFPEPDISTFEGYSTVTINGLNYNYEAGKPLLPVYTTSIAAPGPGASWKIIESEQKKYSDSKPVIYLPDQYEKSGKSLDFEFTIYPEEILRLRDAGIYRDFFLMGLTVFPVQFTTQGLVFHRKIRCEIRFNNSAQPSLSNLSFTDKKLLEKLAINSASAVSYPGTEIPPVENLPLSLTQLPFNQKVKVVVDRFGIYRVTGQDLLDAGISLDEINPQNFRLTNKGKDVAIFIEGDQDGNFDPDDYLEFLGERNEKTFIDRYPDMYSDPFSDNNVYWLSWGGSPGIRMVEESGSAITTRPGQYNRASYYPYTVHLENNSYFARFGNGNTGNLSHTRDNWFFDSGIIAVSKKSYPVSIAYPDSTPPARPVHVRMAFAGNSPVSHSMMVWLNKKLVGQISSGWFGEGLFILDDGDNTNITGLDLFHGMNTIEIQLPQAPTSGANDVVLFNWAEITYDRQYKAVNNYIEFSKPS